MGDLAFFIRLMGRQPGWVILGCVLTLTTLIASISLLTISGWFIAATAMAGAGGAAAIAAFNYIYPSAAIRALALTRVLSRYGERLSTHEATFRVLAHIRAWFFAKAIPLAPSQLAGLRSGDMLSRMTSDIDALDTLYLRILVPTVVAVLTGIAVIVLVALVFEPAAILLGALLLVAGFAIPFWAARRGQPIGQEIVQDTAGARIRTVDTIRGLPDLLTGNAADRARADVDWHMDRLLGHRAGLSRLQGLTSALTGLSADLALVGMVLLALPALASGQIAAPIVALLIFCALASFEAVMPLAGAFQDLGRTREAARRLLAVAFAQPLVNDPADEDRRMPPERLDLRLEGVHFIYPGQEETGRTANAVDGVSLSIHGGRRLALVGPSGSGKSTLLALLMRQYDPTRGNISLGNVDLRHLRQSDLWEKIGFLSQHTELFATTIRANILMGRPEASEEELWKAVRSAGLEVFVKAQPNGLDTWVGETGLQVSGGEARRIALARVLLKDAPIVLLDEPTEGLDSETERDVLAALSALPPQRTVVMVTHRGAFLEGTDEIWNMEDGKLVSAERPKRAGKSTPLSPAMA